MKRLCAIVAFLTMFTTITIARHFLSAAFELNAVYDARREFDREMAEDVDRIRFALARDGVPSMNCKQVFDFISQLKPTPTNFEQL